MPLPELLILSLRFPRAVWPDRPARISVADNAFRLYPKLEQVVFWDVNDEVKWLYSRTGPRTMARRDTNATVPVDVAGASRNGASEDVNSIHVNSTETEATSERNNEQRRQSFWEKTLPAARFRGTMWWRQFDL